MNKIFTGFNRKLSLKKLKKSGILNEYDEFICPECKNDDVYVEMFKKSDFIESECKNCLFKGDFKMLNNIIKRDDKLKKLLNGVQ